jgi:hypothetical protein
MVTLPFGSGFAAAAAGLVASAGFAAGEAPAAGDGEAAGAAGLAASADLAGGAVEAGGAAGAQPKRIPTITISDTAVVRNFPSLPFPPERHRNSRCLRRPSGKQRRSTGSGRDAGFQRHGLVIEPARTARRGLMAVAGHRILGKPARVNRTSQKEILAAAQNRIEGNNGLSAQTSSGNSGESSLLAGASARPSSPAQGSGLVIPGTRSKSVS